MNKVFDIQSYMTKGVERVVSDALKATVKNPRESAYLLKYSFKKRLQIGYICRICARYG